MLFVPELKQSWMSLFANKTMWGKTQKPICASEHLEDFIFHSELFANPWSDYWVKEIPKVCAERYCVSLPSIM